MTSLNVTVYNRQQLKKTFYLKKNVILGIFFHNNVAVTLCVMSLHSNRLYKQPYSTTDSSCLLRKNTSTIIMNQHQRELIALRQKYRNAKTCLENVKEDIAHLLQISPEYLKRHVRDLRVDVDDTCSRVDLLRNDLNSMGCLFSICLEDTARSICPECPYTPTDREQHKAFFRWRTGFLKDNISSIKHKYGELQYELALLSAEAKHKMMTTPTPNEEAKDSHCPICLAEWEEGEVRRGCPTCQHHFHETCIERCLKGESKCPLCRTLVRVRDRMNYEPLF